MQKQDCFPLSIKNGKDKVEIVYRSADSILNNSVIPNLLYTSIADLYEQAFKRYKNYDFMGIRNNNKDGSVQKICTYQSYAQVYEISTMIGSAMLYLNLYAINNEDKRFKMKTIGIYGNSSYEQYLTEIAATMYGITIINILESSSKLTKDHIINQSRVSTIFISSEYIDQFLSEHKKNNQYKHLKVLVILDSVNFNDSLYEYTEGMFKVIKFDDLIDVGIKHICEKPLLTHETVYTISYKLKRVEYPCGVVITHENVLTTIRALNKRIHFGNKDTYTSLLTLTFLKQKMMLNFIISNGARIGICNLSEGHKLYQIKYLNPTVCLLSSKQCLKIYRKLQEVINRSQGMLQNLLKLILAIKLANLKNKRKHRHFIYDYLLFKAFNNFLGNKLKLLIVGDCAIDIEISNFLRISLCCPLIKVFGILECSEWALLSSLNNYSKNIINNPLPHTEFKLVDSKPIVSKAENSMNVKLEQKFVGKLIVKSECISPGYYENSMDEKDVYKENSWLDTHTLVKFNTVNRHLKILFDERDKIVLQNKVIVYPKVLENIYLTVHHYIRDIFIYGDNSRTSLVAIISIDCVNLKQLAQQHNIYDKASILRKREDINKLLLNMINATAAERNIVSYKRPKRVFIEYDKFENLKLYYPGGDKHRDMFKRYYAININDMYTHLV